MGISSPRHVLSIPEPSSCSRPPSPSGNCNCSCSICLTQHATRCFGVIVSRLCVLWYHHFVLTARHVTICCTYWPRSHRFTTPLFALWLHVLRHGFRQALSSLIFPLSFLPCITALEAWRNSVSIHSSAGHIEVVLPSRGTMVPRRRFVRLSMHRDSRHPRREVARLHATTLPSGSTPRVCWHSYRSSRLFSAHDGPT